MGRYNDISPIASKGHTQVASLRCSYVLIYTLLLLIVYYSAYAWLQ